MKEKIIALTLMAIMAAMNIIPVLAATNNLGTYPAPFCAGGVCNFYTIYGSSAKADDLVGGSDVTARLAAENYVLVSTTGGTTASVAGEGARLDTASNRVLLGDALNNAKQTITSTDLPTLLASGEVTDDNGNTYAYTQDFTIDNAATITYGTSGGDLKDPQILITLPSTVTSSNYVYSTRVTFSKLLNISDSSVTDNTITLFGNQYTIGSSSAFTASSKKLVVYGGANTVTLQDGQEQDVTIGETTYKVKSDGANSVTTAVIEVNGVSKSVTQGSTYKISGLDVYVSNVYYYSKESAVSSVQLSLGSQKLTLEDGQEVLFGTSDYVDNTLVSLTGSNGQGLSKIEVFISALDSENDNINVGLSFADPIWKTFNLNFASTTPALDDTNSDSIVMSYSGDRTMTLSFTDYLKNAANIEFAYNNVSALTSTPTIYLQDSNQYPIVVKEGNPVYYKWYVVVDQGDETHLLQLTSLPDGTVSSQDTVKFKDVITGTLYEKTIAPTTDCDNGGCNESMQIGSQTYYVRVLNASTKAAGSVQVTWDDTNQYTGCAADTGAGYGITGYVKLFPALKAKSGEYVYLVNNYSAFATNVTLCLPGNKVYAIDTTAASNTFSSTGAQFSFSWNLGTGVVAMGPLNQSKAGVAILENKQADGSTKGVVYMPITYVGSTSKKIAVSTPTFSDTTSGLASFVALGSNSYVSKAYDVYGTLVTYDTTGDQGKITALVPVDQIYSNIFFLLDTAKVTTSTTGGNTVKQVVPISDSVSKLDSDISDPTTVKKNMVLIGGSCANSLVQKLVDSGKLDAKYTCAGGTPGAGWETGKGYIFYVVDAFATGYDAIILAGTNAIDTRNACSVMQKYDNTDIAAKLSVQTKVAVTAVSGAGITVLA